MLSAIIYFLLLFIVQIVGAALAGLWVVFFPTSMPFIPLLGHVLLVVEALLCLGLWVWFYRIEAPARRSMNGAPVRVGFITLRPLARDVEPKAVPPYVYALSVVGMLAFGFGLDGLLKACGLPEGDSMQQFGEMVRYPLCILCIAFVGPLCEELVFRVGILRSLYRAGAPLWLAVGLSGVLFGLVHGNLEQGVPAIFSGLLLGALYVRTGNLRLCLPAHVANNLASVLLLLAGLGDAALPLWLCIALLVASIVLFYPVFKSRHANRNA